MNSAILKKIFLSCFLIAVVITFTTNLPLTCYADDCTIRIEVSPYQVNIESGGVAHMVRILTYTSYANTKDVFVYINDNESPIDPEYIEKTRDSVGHLVVKIDIEALQLAELQQGVHELTIAVILKSADTCDTLTGIGEIYIIEKQGS